MFSPPPSPLPPPHDPSAAPPACVSTRPQRLARGRRLIALLVPVAILLLLNLASRRAARDPLIDHFPSTAPAPRHPSHAQAGRRTHHHSPRQLGDPADEVPSLAPTATTTTSAGTQSSTPQQLGAAAAATAVPSIPPTPYPVPTPFPQPFDSSLAYNFTTTTCNTFFNQFTTNITFRACRPFSLLLGTSSTFFDVQANLTELTAVMGGTCDTPQTIDQCRSTMDWLAAEIVKPTVCGTDMTAQNAMVLRALNGFKTYDLMRQAGCLVNQRSNAYCFVEAVASTSPSDTYFYALPLGTPVPQTSTPSCSACIKSLMALYANHATDTTLPLSKSYSSAQKLASNTCGADYALAVSNASSRRIARESFWISGTLFGLIFGILSPLL